MIPFIHPDRREALFGGHGSVLVESLAGTLCPPFTAALHCQLTARGRVGEHVQQADDELVIVLEGEATLTVNGKPLDAGPGSVIGLTQGDRLVIENAADVPLRYLIVKARHR